MRFRNESLVRSYPRELCEVEMNINGKLSCLYHSCAQNFIWFVLETLSLIIAPRRQSLQATGSSGQQKYCLFVPFVSFSCLVFAQW